jgi:fructose-1,6-bisphosphatase/inositol monophosphatase family enzyme
MNLDLALSIATDAAHAAGEVLNKRFRTKLTVKMKSSPRDLVTEVDELCQEAIIATIRKHFPTHRFIAEETGADALGDTESHYAWIIDPLDGTKNFIRGKPDFALNIALEENGTIVLGLMHYPLKGVTMSGVKGKGAFINGSPVKLRNTESMVDAILSTNIRLRAGQCTREVLHVAVPSCSSVHNYGCAAEELGAVLQGENDGVFYEHVGLWDVAAGCLMIKEAGGKAEIRKEEDGNPRSKVSCVACTKAIFDELCAFLWK